VTPSLAALLERASARINRLGPADALAAMERGALLIDIRSDDARERDGIVPGSLHIPRTVLEWRLAPDSDWRNPHVTGPDEEVVLLCDHGYSSILAAATLAELGYARAADVVGGYDAWKGEGLPTRAAPRRSRGDLPGMHGRD
jgi:rhodanese-related sulfurtransferase